MSAKPKILVTRRYPPAVLERCRRDYEATINDSDENYDPETLLRLSKGMDGLLPTLTNRLDKEAIDQLPESIKIIATYSVGYEHIDLAAAKARGIVVTNTPDVLTDATADIALLLMLGAARRGAEGDRLCRDGGWVGWTPTFMTGIEMTGKRLGIYGMGRIGRAVAQRARGFEMEIHYHNRSRLSPEDEQGAIYHETPESLLPVSDFLSLNCPNTTETHHFLNAERIDLLPPNPVVVNTARGSVVHDESLIAALKSGRVAAAGLDVFENEPNFDPRYKDLPNTFLLPHLGSATTETRNAMGFRALDNLDVFFKGGEPKDRLA